METVDAAGRKLDDDRVEHMLAGLGLRIRRLRREQGQTLEGLALITGSSAAQLSRLETGERLPSLEIALRLALSLGVPLEDLVADDQAPTPGVVVRGQEAPIFDGEGYRYQPLVPDAGPEGITAVRVIYPADRDPDDDLRQHEGQEWLYVLRGRLRLTLGKERAVLRAGDAAFFDALLPHAFDVLSEEDAEVLMVSCVPCTHRVSGSKGHHTFVDVHATSAGVTTARPELGPDT